MKDWFYAPGHALVSPAAGLTKSRLVVTIRRGYKSLSELEAFFGVHFAPEEREDVLQLIKLYAPMAYDSLGGCSGCGGCGGE